MGTVSSIEPKNIIRVRLLLRSMTTTALVNVNPLDNGLSVKLGRLALNLDDGALSAENAMEEMDRNREVADACEHEGGAIKEDLALRKAAGRGAECNM